MHRIVIPAVLTLLLAGACGPLIELEDENTVLRSTVDSLEIVIAECRGQGDLLQERLAAIEAENLRLDDRNRELSARVVEVQHGDPSSAPTEPNAGIEEIGEPGTGTYAANEASQAESGVSEIREPSANTPATGAAPAMTNSADAIPAPRYDGKVSAGLEFLQRYQLALNAYNDKKYVECTSMFTALLSGSSANDMTDNCVYWLGEAAVQQGQTTRAIDLFSTVIGYRGSDKVDDALVSRATVYSREGNKSAARADLDRLIREFPDSEHIGIARQMLRNLR